MPSSTNAAALTISDLNTGLIAAAKLGRRKLVDLCLSRGAQVDVSDARGLTALHYASMNGHHSVVETLLSHGAAEAYLNEVERGGESTRASSTPRVYASPLHLSILRGAVRVVWLLLGAGYATTDTDACGNNALHLACCCTIPSQEDQVSILRSVMSAGFDPECRNWYGMRAVDMLPSHALEARRLLLASHAQTKCYATGTPFGREELRYLCHSSGRFFSEDASVGMTVRASPTSTVVKPVRMGAEVVYRVADAEAALETALNPFGVEASTAAAAPAAGVSGFSSPLRGSLRGVVGVDSTPGRSPGSSSPPLARGSPLFKSASGGELDSPDALPRPRLERGISAAIAEVDEEEEEEPEELPPPAPAPVQVTARSASAPEAAPVEPEPEPAPPAGPSLELELYFNPMHVAALEAALSHVMALHGDVALIARGRAALDRLEAAAALKVQVEDVSDSRPIASRTVVLPALAALSRANAAGVGVTTLTEARLGLDIAVAELELTGAVAVCSVIPVATHAYDADLDRLRRAVEAGNTLNAAVVSVTASRDAAFAPLDAIAAAAAAATSSTTLPPPASSRASLAPRSSIGQGDGNASVTGSSVSAPRSTGGGDRRGGAPTGRGSVTGPLSASPSAVIPGSSALELSPEGKPWRNRDAAIPLLSVDAALLSRASALLARLTCEVGVTDAVSAATAAHDALLAAAAAHDSEDASLLLVPELPPEEAAAVAAAVAAAAAAAAAPPPPVKAKAGGKAAVAAAPAPPAGPVFPPTSLHLDAFGIPLPFTPQVEAHAKLTSACTELTRILSSARVSGADAACIHAADAALHTLRAGADAALQKEKERVKTFREERARAEKKARKAKKK